MASKGVAAADWYDKLGVILRKHDIAGPRSVNIDSVELVVSERHHGAIITVQTNSPTFLLEAIDLTLTGWGARAKEEQQNAEQQ